MLLAAEPDDARPVELRVGIVAFQSFQTSIDPYERLFRDLADDFDRPMRFRLAIGTYGDVLHWLERGLVDVAMLTPGVFAVARQITREGKPCCEYLVSRRQRIDDGTQSGDYREAYHSVCVVPAGSKLRTLDDLRRAIDVGQARLIFVDPLSSSGRLAPAFVLAQLGMLAAPQHVSFSYSHSNSLRLLAARNDGQEHVAFVSDQALHSTGEKSAHRKLEFGELERLTIPLDVVVARRGYEHAGRVAECLANHRDEQGRSDFVRFDDWEVRYAEVERWYAQLRIAGDSEESQSVSLDELGQMLLHYARARPASQRPRLALVLSGGGAKCAYQIGAVAALEEQLAKLREETGETGLEISLVVGTSGGAINALAVALGTSSTAEGREQLKNAWRSLDQREIVRPSKLVRGNMGLWFVCIQTTVVLWVVRKYVARHDRRAWAIVWMLLTLGGVQLAIGQAGFSPWRWLGDHHFLHHAWLWSTFGVERAGVFLLFAGTALLVQQWRLSRRRGYLALPRRTAAWGLAVGLLGLPLAQLLTILFYEKTLSDSSGIERALARNFADLADGELVRAAKPPLKSVAGTPPERLQSLGRQILARRLLSRDLVITGSCLERTSAELPSDLYFYASAGRSAPPDFDHRGVALAERPELLLDVVMGSGSIFPVFPPRTLADFPAPGERVELVDGGFAHNSPVEAAVRWGATHIVLVEAAPLERGERRNFLQNAAGAFSHLYQQAQLVDARSRENDPVVIFSLRPDPPHLCVLDFADNLIDAAIDKGYREAAGDGRRRFRKELGEPVFWEP
jgi:predicted acylesterase/phospholipase RssA/ABC-type phosphate/phosphonate transport system substrate-binding protein